jgi:hypothetical protein
MQPRTHSKNVWDYDLAAFGIVVELAEVPSVAMPGCKGEVDAHKHNQKWHGIAACHSANKKEAQVDQNLGKIVRRGDQIKPIPAKRVVS